MEATSFATRARLALLNISPLLLYSALSLLVFSVFLPLLSWTTFSDDDSHILRVAVEYGWLQHYFDPDVYRQLSVANYTPTILTVYKLLANLVGLSPAGFLLFPLCMMALLSTLAGLLVHRLTDDRWPGAVVIVLLFSNFSLHTLMARPYTLHYIIGGIFALLALLAVFRSIEFRSCILASAYMLLAMLGKEVYLMLPVLVGLLALYRRSGLLVCAATASLLIYAVIRILVLGLPVGSGNEIDYYSGVLGISTSAWSAFLLFYAGSRFIIIAVTVLAVLANFGRALQFLPLALLFGLPALAVPHGITAPDLHADRIFFALDCALVIVSVLVLNSSLLFKNASRWQALVAVYCFAMIMHGLNVTNWREEVQATADYKITRFLIENSEQLIGDTILLPLNFIQGDLMRTMMVLEGESFLLTQNCLDAQNLPADSLTAFDSLGEPVEYDQLRQSCQAGQTGASVISPVQVDDGYVSWQLGLEAGFTGGVLFVDRALAVPLPQFAAQLVLPKPGEKYRFFANRENEWWFSETMPINIVDSR